MRDAAAIALVLVAATTGAGVAHAQTVGQPSLTVVATDDRFTWGEERELTLVVANDGRVVAGGAPALRSQVTTARNVELSVARSRLPAALNRSVSFSRNRLVLGNVPSGDAARATLNVSVGEGLEQGVYRIPLVLSYEYSTLARESGDGVETNERERERLVQVPIRVADRPRITLSAVEGQSIGPGETARYRVTVANEGTELASQVAVTLRTDGVTARFGSPNHAGSQTWLYFDTLAPGERQRRSVTVTVPPATAPGPYFVAGTARYRRPGGFDERSDTLGFGIRVSAGAPLEPTPGRTTPTDRPNETSRMAPPPE